MRKNDLIIAIKKKALELGYESCGIIKIDAVRDYECKLDERISKVPETKPFYDMFRKYAFPDKTYEWAKSIVVCVTRYGKYKVPENIEGLIGKYYLFDYKLQKHTKGYSDNILFETYLNELGLKTTKELHGVTSARWAAFKAGLGIIRKNNFFYTKNGSWILIDTWLIDEELELIETHDFKPCPEECRECLTSCPTGALSQSYCTNMGTCITRLTWGLNDLASEELRVKMGKWIYGCDECQNACPINKTTWEDVEKYPDINELEKHISLEKIFLMNQETLTQVMLPKFWFIKVENLFMWKINCLRAMANNFETKYEKYIKEALNDENEKVKKTALWACEKVGI